VSEGGGDGFEEVEVGELFVHAVFGPHGFDAEQIAFLKTIGALFDGGLLEVVQERRLSGAGSGAGKHVAARVNDARERVRSIERGA
jgi:hypothetical protein